jgi:aminotransferase
VITDEIYEYIRYDNRSHISPATVGGLRGRTVTIMGFSKTFAVAGWRLGYAVAPQEMALAIRLVMDAYYCCPPTPLQHGVIAGLYAPLEYFQQLRSDYQKKRDMLFNALLEAGLAPLLPQGAFYIFTDISNLGCQTAREAAMKLLTGAGVASVPGSAFYRSKIGEQLVRFCYAVEFDVLQEACVRLLHFRNKERESVQGRSV